MWILKGITGLVKSVMFTNPYGNVSLAEIRNHGVGYYQFSRSEETRQKEMETLDELRGQV